MARDYDGASGVRPVVRMFLHGCNYPWSADRGTVFYGLDFGANVWGSHLGVSTRRAAVARDLEAMAAVGFTLVRWFVFTDGRAGILYDDAGLPSGLDEFFFGDLDVALESAREADMRLLLVALDHHWAFRGLRASIADPVSGLLLEGSLPHGRADVLLSQDGHDALLESVLVPVVARYAPGGARADLAPIVAGWELMNEPDWLLQEWENDLSPRVSRPVPFETFAVLLARFNDAVHTRTAAFTTIGGGRLGNLWAWDDDALGLDVLQVHHYPDAAGAADDEALFGARSEVRRAARPVVLGEFPGGRGEYLERALQAGFAGAWPWSFSGTDRYGRIPPEPYKAFARAHPHLVNPRVQP